MQDVLTPIKESLNIHFGRTDMLNHRFASIKYDTLKITVDKLNSKDVEFLYAVLGSYESIEMQIKRSGTGLTILIWELANEHHNQPTL